MAKKIYNVRGIYYKFDSKKNCIEINGLLGKYRRGYSGLRLIGSNKFFFDSFNNYRKFLGFINEQMEGVSNGYFIELNFIGLGYRFLHFGNILFLKVGYAHYIKIVVPDSIIAFGYKKRLILFGLSLEILRNFSNKIKFCKKPDAYKAKGIQYLNDKLKIKEGKQQQ